MPTIRAAFGAEFFLTDMELCGILAFLAWWFVQHRDDYDHPAFVALQDMRLELERLERRS